MPDRVPEDMPDRMLEDMPDRMREGMPDRMPDGMPEDMPEHLPEDMPDRMPEDMSDRMPEDLPVTKCINVMVGITRSKVIWFFFVCGKDQVDFRDGFSMPLQMCVFFHHFISSDSSVSP